MQQGKANKQGPRYTETEKFIDIDGEKIDVSLISPLGAPKGKVLMLHGAGESSKHRMLPLARETAKLGWECLVFSLPGHGSSSGSLLGSTLSGRKQMTKKIAEALNFWPADIVLGVSMGAHTAISLLEDNLNLTEKLILLVPAMYAAEAEDVPFGPEFSRILRSPKSYHSSKNLGIIQNYKGRLVIVEAEKDQVIPSDVTVMLAGAASQAKTQKIVAKGSEHQITFWLAAKPHRLERFARAIDRFDFTEFN